MNHEEDGPVAPGHLMAAEIREQPDVRSIVSRYRSSDRLLAVGRQTAVVDILPLQPLALDLAVARGLDPDLPRGLNKVTSTL